jgi:hypothetical protein
VGELVGKRFLAHRIHHVYLPELGENMRIDLPAHTRPSDQEPVDRATVAEGGTSPELEGYEVSRSPEEMAGMLRAALKGTPMEGLDEEPEPPK